MNDEIRKALDRKRDDLAWADADLAIRPEAPGTAKMAHVFAFKAGFDAACKLFEGMPEALELAKHRIVCIDAGMHFKNRKCKACEAAKAVEQALADFKARVEVGDE